MKVLLDECLPKKLNRVVAAESVMTVPERGWAGIVNGALLRLAEQEFDVFLTNNQNLEHQQNLKMFDLAIVVLAASTLGAPHVERQPDENSEGSSCIIIPHRHCRFLC